MRPLAKYEVIVKVQIPLASNDPNVRCLVYQEGRTFGTQQLLTPRTVKALNGDKKGYFIAIFNGMAPRYIIKDRVEAQDW